MKTCTVSGTDFEVVCCKEAVVINRPPRPAFWHGHFVRIGKSIQKQFAFSMLQFSLTEQPNALEIMSSVLKYTKIEIDLLYNTECSF